MRGAASVVAAAPAPAVPWSSPRFNQEASPASAGADGHSAVLIPMLAARAARVRIGVGPCSGPGGGAAASSSSSGSSERLMDDSVSSGKLQSGSSSRSSGVGKAARLK